MISSADRHFDRPQLTKWNKRRIAAAENHCDARKGLMSSLEQKSHLLSSVKPLKAAHSVVVKVSALHTQACIKFFTLAVEDARLETDSLGVATGTDAPAYFS